MIQRIRLREPFCGLSHMAGAGLSIVGLLALLSLSHGKPWHLTAFAVYGVSMVLLFSASAVYHLLPVGPAQIERLRAFDMAAIYLLSANVLLGLLMDVADGAFFGQHALAYSILAYAAILLHRRVRMFPPVAQVIQIVPLLLLNDLIVLAIRMLAGADFPGYRYFLGSLVAGVVWPVVSVLLKLPQRPKSDPGRV